MLTFTVLPFPDIELFLDFFDLELFHELPDLELIFDLLSHYLIQLPSAIR